MGIVGLLPLLKDVIKKVPLENFTGQCIAVDAYSWLHKGIRSVALGLFQDEDRNEYLDKLVASCMKRVQQLQKYDIRPILIFDGGHLPLKAGQESMRSASRASAREKAIEILEKGDETAAWPYIMRSIDVTPYMAYRLIRECKRYNVDTLVAPYEADAQMAFLEKEGHVSAIITEDSDLILFGCKKILYKWDSNDCVEMLEPALISKILSPDMHSFSFTMFRQMCILSGCDYLQSILGMGLKTAHRLLNQFRTIDRVLMYLESDRKYSVPRGYKTDFDMAELTFNHQRVYDIEKKCLVHMNPIDPEILERYSCDRFLGPDISPELAIEIAEGRIDPITHSAYKDDLPQVPVKPRETIKSILKSTNRWPPFTRERPVAEQDRQAVPILPSTLLSGSAQRITLKRPYSPPLPAEEEKIEETIALEESSQRISTAIQSSISQLRQGGMKIGGNLTKFLYNSSRPLNTKKNAIFGNSVMFSKIPRIHSAEEKDDSSQPNMSPAVSPENVDTACNLNA